MSLMGYPKNITDPMADEIFLYVKSNDRVSCREIRAYLKELGYRRLPSLKAIGYFCKGHDSIDKYSESGTYVNLYKYEEK